MPVDLAAARKFSSIIQNSRANCSIAGPAVYVWPVNLQVYSTKKPLLRAARKSRTSPLPTWAAVLLVVSPCRCWFHWSVSRRTGVVAKKDTSPIKVRAWTWDRSRRVSEFFKNLQNDTMISAFIFDGYITSTSHTKSYNPRITLTTPHQISSDSRLTKLPQFSAFIT